MPARPCMPKQSEADFTNQVLAAAALFGWLSAHFRPARTTRGWRTACQGNAAGFPDLVLVKGARIIYAELKVPPNRPTRDQRAWLDALRAAGQDARLWGPGDWGEIEATLRGVK